MKMLPDLILASGSPRRRELLSRLGLKFTVSVPKTDESSRPGESPADLVARLAALKARAIAAIRPEATVIAADTVVAVAGKALGKPGCAERAFSDLKALAGRTHEVFTGLHVASAGQEFCKTVRTAVSFGQFPDEVLKAYAETGEGFDKAGAYAIQGIGAFLISSINGSPSSVIGLPLEETARILCALGYPLFHEGKKP
ncbi:MAG: Maf family protein [Succinivibrio sp.]|nr:Maf family protein [Succinivibrio sp.]